MKRIIFILNMIVILYESNSQINLDDQLRRKINNTTKFRVHQAETIKLPGPDARVTKFPRIKTIDYTVIGGDANVRTEKIVYLPEQVIVNYYSNKNCSDGKRGWTQDLTLKVTEGQTIKFGNTVTSEKNKTHTFGLKIPFVQDKFPVTGTELNYTFNYSTKSGSSETNENEQTTTKEETITRTVNFEVDSNKALFVKFQVTKYTIKAPFVATLIVDGDVTVENIISTRLGNQTSEKVQGEEVIPLRTLLSSQERTFSLTGFLESSKAGMEDVQFAEVSFPPDSCDQFVIEPLIAIMEKLSANKSLTTKETETLQSNEFADAIKTRAKKMRFQKYIN